MNLSLDNITLIAFYPTCLGYKLKTDELDINSIFGKLHRLFFSFFMVADIAWAKNAPDCGHLG